MGDWTTTKWSCLLLFWLIFIVLCMKVWKLIRKDQHNLAMHPCMLSLKSCSTLCNSMDCSPPGFSVHGILQAKILEWVAMPSSKGSSRPRETQVSGLAGRFFSIWATREAQFSHSYTKLSLVISLMLKNLYYVQVERRRIFLLKVRTHPLLGTHTYTCMYTGTYTTHIHTHVPHTIMHPRLPLWMTLSRCLILLSLILTVQWE